MDNRVEKNGKLVVTIIFEVKENLESEMTVDEYSKYFMENKIKVTGSCRTADMRKGKVIKNNNSELTLKDNEEELNNFTVTEDLDYKPDDKNERQYIVEIFNETGNDFSKIRGNIYLGDENELLEVSPSEIISNHKNNSTFELPFWIEIPAKEKLTFYIIVQTTDENFAPDTKQ